MKRTLLLLVLIFLAGQASAQVQTLVNGPIEHGGFGGHRSKLTWIAGEPEYMIGGEGAWLINHRLYLGGGGYGLGTIHRLPNLNDGTRRHIEAGYGGAILGYKFDGTQLLHMSAQVMVGGGGITVLTGSRPKDHADTLDETAFFVVEPGVEANLNVTRFFQIGVEASYRLISGSTLDEIEDQDLTGPSLGVGLRFGKF